jgi:PleD family two-component response regulator
MTRRILIVEDDPAIRMLVKAVLEGEGHEVVEVCDGPSAHPTARDVKPDLVLLDIGLPGLDGFGVLGQLKADEDLRDVPVMMVTAWGDPELVAKALDRGAHDYVRKPFDVDDLRQRVAAALVRGEALGGLADQAELTQAIVDRVAANKTFSLVLLELNGTDGDVSLLHAAARRLDQRVRRADLLGRWADSAFVVIADGTDLGGAGALAHDLRAAIASRPLDTAAASRRITASVGVAQAAPGESADELLARAGAALERAGSDAVLLADESLHIAV